MNGILVVDMERCTGCKLCEIVCSVKKEGVSDPARSRIRITIQRGGKNRLPTFCQHCEEPLCAAVCPVNAVRKDESTGLIFLDRELCVGCRACVSACPLFGVGFDSVENKALRCDLCHGDPACVKYCEAGAIQYVDRDQFPTNKQRAAAKKLYSP